MSSFINRLRRLRNLILISVAIVLMSLHSWNASAFSVQVGRAPDNTLSLVLSAIARAHQSLQVNIYELASPEIAQALIAQINRGVRVEILQEGEPVGGISAASRGLQAQIGQAMQAHPGCCRYVEMRKSAGGTRRFRYDHAKYIVIDQSALLLGSENYSPGGHPEPDSLGNRGWEVLVYDPQPARWFSQLFAIDSDPRQPDIHDLLNRGAVSKPLPKGPQAPLNLPGSSNPVFEATDGQIITSPDTSLNGLVRLLQSAQKSLDIEQMSFNMNWVINQSGYPGTPSMSPLADAIIAAARRGVRVRILLNDEYAFMGGGGGHNNGSDGTGAVASSLYQELTGPVSAKKPTINRRTVESLMQLARKERLPLEARIANLQAMGVSYIHNKGVIVDGNVTLISSINWTQNSITNNREAALALKSPQIAAYFGQAFNQDWTRSASSLRVSAYPAMSLTNFTFANEGSTLAANSINALTRSRVVAPTICPSELSVTAKIGDIKSVDNIDPSYLALGQITLAGKFVRETRDKRCILLGPGNLALELRKSTNETLIAALEGFTTSFKPFSIRAEFLADANVANGQVLEGSSSGGGRRRRLGTAVLSFNAE